MRHQVASSRFSRPIGHRNLMFRTAVTDLLRHESIETTHAKAMQIRRLAERVITRGKQGSLHQRRLASAFLTDEKIVKKLFDEIGPRYKERPGGYVRVIKVGPRQGDAALISIVELV
ncbi:MAG: 50S ribosomal protein L17 [Chloroflexi bacterium]|nr:50S ribosomal protein L17 [Chloroflexota bacterium]